MLSLGGSAWPELPERPLVLLPLGSTEQHGPHLPFDTDARIATAVAAGAAPALEARLGGPVVLAPAVVYGASGEHQGFAGTVSIGHEALHFVVLELARSLRSWAGRVVIVNGHGGNVPTLASAVPQLVREQHPIAWAPCAPLPAAAGAASGADRGLPAADAHAGRWETSLLLHLDPEAVRMPLPTAGEGRPMAALMPVLTAGGVAAVSPSGILGDPTGAGAGEGAAILAALVDGLVERIAAGGIDARGMLVAPGRP